MNNYWASSLKQARRCVVAVIGLTVLVIGIMMIVLPGPAFIVIPAGLTILATEFLWARKLLKKIKGGLLKVKSGINREAK
jgi:uncharacterized protein (TIGR02611 family)